VMWFARERALEALPALPPRTRAAVEALTPGPVTLLLPNPDDRFPLAAGPAGAGAALGVRVPAFARGQAALAGVRLAVLQSSANHAGGPDAKRLDEIPEDIRAGADLVLDAGSLPGTPSTVIDLQRFEGTGDWAVVREGAMPRADLARALGIVGRP
jgi:L-threonylcarbamoyladenylate synthase